MINNEQVEGEILSSNSSLVDASLDLSKRLPGFEN